jgi:hypothetical protein
MKHLFILLLTFNATLLLGQTSQKKDFIPPPNYDTTNIDIKSINSFYFCKKLFAIPRNCDNKDQSSCSSFSAQIKKLDKDINNGQISCYDGTSLSWMSFDTEEIARQNFESYPGQIKKQMKKFKQEKINLFVCDKEVSTYRLTYTTLQGYDFTQLVFYGTINGEIIFGQLNLRNKVKSSLELSELFQQLIRF